MATRSGTNTALGPRSLGTGNRPGASAGVADARASIPASFFARATTPMLLLDNERRLRQANRAALRLFELQLSALTRHRLDQLIAGTSTETLETEWRRLLDAGQGHGRLQIRRPGGGPTEFHYSATARIAAELHLLVLVQAPARPGTAGHSPALSRREREVLTWIANGQEGRALAERLQIAPETVRRHLSNARRKLGGRSRAHAVALALACGEIDWPEPDQGSGDEPTVESAAQ